MLTIGQLAQRFGLATHVLRHWEAMGLLIPETRVNGRRRYTEEHAVRIAMILHAKSAGLSLGQVRDVLDAPDRAARKDLLSDHHADLERRIRAIQQSKQMIEHVLQCDAEDITQCPRFQQIVTAGTAMQPR